MVERTTKRERRGGVRKTEREKEIGKGEGDKGRAGKREGEGKREGLTGRKRGRSRGRERVAERGGERHRGKRRLGGRGVHF